MKTDYLYKLAEREKIDIYNYQMINSKARIINYSNINFIFIDYSKLENSIDEKCTLAHELRSLLFKQFLSCNLRR